MFCSFCKETLRALSRKVYARGRENKRKLFSRHSSHHPFVSKTFPWWLRLRLSWVLSNQNSNFWRKFDNHWLGTKKKKQKKKKKIVDSCNFLITICVTWSSSQQWSMIPWLIHIPWHHEWTLMNDIKYVCRIGIPILVLFFSHVMHALESLMSSTLCMPECMFVK